MGLRDIVRSAVTGEWLNDSPRDSRIVNQQGYDVISAPLALYDALETQVLGMDAMARACISLITKQIMSLEMRALDEETYEPAPRNSDGSGARFNRLMRFGIDGGTATDFKAQLVYDLLLHGNAFVYPRYETRVRGGRRVRLLNDAEVVNPALVEKHRLNDRRVRYVIEGGGTLSSDEVVHVKLPPSRWENRLMGQPPLSQASNVLRTASLASDQIVSNLRNRLSPVAVVLDVNAGSTAERRRFVGDMAADLERRSPWKLFMPGADPKVLPMTPQSADMLALREDNRVEIARAFHLPEPIVQINTTEWGNGIENLRRLFWQITLRPICTLIEDALSQMVGDRYRVRFDEIDILRGDWSALASFINAVKPAIHGDYLSVNEIRRLSSHPPREGQDGLKPAPDRVPVTEMTSDDDREAPAADTEDAAGPADAQE